LFSLLSDAGVAGKSTFAPFASSAHLVDFIRRGISETFLKEGASREELIIRALHVYRCVVIHGVQ
jgi:hypothetical protein